eukprot:3936297-Rhodomonas_salina.1
MAEETWIGIWGQEEGRVEDKVITALQTRSSAALQGAKDLLSFVKWNAELADQVHCSLLTLLQCLSSDHYSLFSNQLFTAQCSVLSAHLRDHFSLLTAHCSE